MMGKVDVNGPGTHAVWQFLKAEADMKEVSWNFSAYFLVDRTGAVKGYNLRPRGNEIGYDLPSALLADLQAAIKST
jgi:glutathione peroxidase